VQPLQWPAAKCGTIGGGQEFYQLRRKLKKSSSTAAVEKPKLAAFWDWNGVGIGIEHRDSWKSGEVAAASCNVAGCRR